MSRKAPLPPRMRMAVNALLGMGLLQVLKILPTNDCVPYLYIIAVTQCLTAWKIQVHLLIEFLVDFDHVPLDICNYAACCSVSGVQYISLKHHPVNICLHDFMGESSSVSGFLGYIYPADVRPHPPSGHPPVRFFGPSQFCCLADSWIPQTPEMSESNYLTMKQDVLVLTRTSKPMQTHCA